MVLVRKGGALKAVLFVLSGVLLATAGTVSAMAHRYERTIAPGVTVAGLAVGGKTREAAARSLTSWWAEVQDREIVFRAPQLTEPPKGMTARRMGVVLDLDRTLALMPTEDFWAVSSRQILGKRPAGLACEPVLAQTAGGLSTLDRFVRAHLKPHRPAKADLVDGQVVTSPEQTTVALDQPSVLAVIRSALLSGETVDLPLKAASKHVSDESLAEIKEVVSSYTTEYNAGNANRASNIRNAAQRLSGTVILPGETFSFNKTLGRRTVKNGFKLAGVYNEGRHDFDIGGGICQVSGTLYNAVLLAGLKIVSRSNHTFPVPYLPLGRDATVSYPQPDFAFLNDTGRPLAVSATAGNGKVTFRILGVKEPGQTVRVTTAGESSWGNPVKTVVDPSLGPGRRVVEEPGGSGHRITTYRTVYKDGSEVRRENLGTSYYPGGTRIVRVGPARPKPPVPAPAEPEGSPAPPPVPDSSGGL